MITLTAFVIVYFVIEGQAKPALTLDYKLLNATTLEMSCLGTGLITYFYKKGNDLHSFDNIVEVQSTYRECNIKAKVTMVHCSCVEITKITCCISDALNVTEGDSWQCVTFINNTKISSNVNVVSKHHQTSSPPMTSQITDETNNISVNGTEIVNEFAVTVSYKNGNGKDENKHTDVQASVKTIAAALAGPVILLYVGLIAFFVRKKLVLCYKRSTDSGDTNERPVATNDNEISTVAILQYATNTTHTEQSMAQTCSINQLENDAIPRHGNVHYDDQVYSFIRDSLINNSGDIFQDRSKRTSDQTDPLPEDYTYSVVNKTAIKTPDERRTEIDVAVSTASNLPTCNYVYSMVNKKKKQAEPQKD